MTAGEEPLVGAAIGVGMTAEAAERGGADFLLALNAGRYRVMGAASVAAMLPLADSNRFTDDFARREILDQVSIPVFFGAAAFDARLDLKRFMGEIAEAGYHGVANFPTAIHYDGRFRLALEEAGLGFGREVAMLAEARRAGLMTFGYAKTRGEIRQMVEAGIDIICLNFGWNAGGVRGVTQAFTLHEAADRARRIFHRIRQERPEAICVVEGGPIVNPDDMYRVCRDAKADGYVGGSTLDRVPLEMSVMQVTSAFKAINVLREADAAHNKALARAARLAGVAGQSEAVRAMLEQALRLAEASLPVLILGERGLGRTALARAMHALGGRGGPVTVLNAADPAGDDEALLFGAEPSFGRRRHSGALETPQGTVIVENADRLSDAARARIADWLERGVFERAGGARTHVAQARLILIAEPCRSADDGFHGALAPRLQARVEVPPLRDRPEDIPGYAQLFLKAVGESKRLGRLEISPDGYRTLFAHTWPENTRELRRVVEQAAIMASGPVIGSAELVATIAMAGAAQPAPEAALRPAAEKDWILDALRRNRFRRGETAAFLGISRKTLYNKMQRHGLLD